MGLTPVQQHTGYSGAGNDHRFWQLKGPQAGETGNGDGGALFCITP